jgi:hypothetical protein
LVVVTEYIYVFIFGRESFIKSLQGNPLAEAASNGNARTNPGDSVILVRHQEVGSQEQEPIYVMTWKA